MKLKISVLKLEKIGMAKRWGSNEEHITNDITEDNKCYNNDITENNKGKESKVNKDIYSAFFEEAWSLYPSKKGKGKISDTKKIEFYKLGGRIEKMYKQVY